MEELVCRYRRGALRLTILYAVSSEVNERGGGDRTNDNNQRYRPVRQKTFAEKENEERNRTDGKRCRIRLPDMPDEIPYSFEKSSRESL